MSDFDDVIERMRAMYLLAVERAERAELRAAQLERLINEQCDEIESLKTRKVA